MNKHQQRQKSLEKAITYLHSRIKTLESLANRYAWYRLAVFLGGLVTGILLYWAHEIAGWTLLGFMLLVFNIVAFYHRKIERSLKKHRIWREMKTIQLAKIKLDWENIPESNFRSGEEDHPFEIDLDITGRHSLFQLLDISFSKEGQRLLGKWLLNRFPDLPEIQKRQALIKELAKLPGFREKLLLNFSLVSAEQLNGKKFLEKLSFRPKSAWKWALPVLTLLAAANILLFALFSLGILSNFWVYGLIIYGLIYFFNQVALKHIFSDVLFLEEELGKIKAILKFLESYPYKNQSVLAELCRVFLSPEKRPSHHLKHLHRVMFAIGLRMNPAMTLLLNLCFPWDFFFARQLEKAKADLAKILPAWLHIWTELEALISLANFAWLNPESSFPEFILPDQNKHDAIMLEAKWLGHPLLPVKQKVCNDFSFAQPGEMALITGSNMAGKSTFLKALGINLALAYAGGTVDAGQFKTALFRIFTSIKVSDSVTDGFSYFYAEVRRLKALLNALDEENRYPLFYLIDEIFRGTNNRERYLGSQSYIRALTGKKGVGVISTHDLELTRLADEISLLHNFHFREEVTNGKMVFDYRLRPGPCPTTNALIIMKMEGLPVDHN